MFRSFLNIVINIWYMLVIESAVRKDCKRKLHNHLVVHVTFTLSYADFSCL